MKPSFLAKLLDRIEHVSTDELQSYLQQLAREKSRSVANSELVNRLRIAIEDASGSAGSPDDPAAGFDAFAERAGVLGELLAESTGLLEEGRGKVAELAAKTTALQAFAQQVCVTQ